MPAAAKTRWTVQFSRSSQIQAALLLAAFVFVFFRSLMGLKYKWLTDQDWSHGPIIPLFSAYLVYINWDRIRGTPTNGAWLGIPIMLFSLASYVFFTYFYIYIYLQYASMLLTLLGIIIACCGLPSMRFLFIPWLYLFFAVPLPMGIYFKLTNPLRTLAAGVATSVLSLDSNLIIDRVGTGILYDHLSGASGNLEVADACSGMRSTITLCALGVAVAFMSDRKLWHRILLIIACVPIAVFSNFIRVLTTCYLHIYVDPKYAGGNYHMTLGLITLLIAFAIFSGLGWILNNLFVTREDDEDDLEAAPS
ncbi:MAG: exosortase/archaeosortase family protein [Phycisphaerales bacterium]|nr:exosortase/archaeosortase family protein [Phycisphaerales bacterium]